jgi:two-component system response regulator WspF
MGYGALDAVDTPVLGPGGELAGAVPLLRKLDVIGKLIGMPRQHGAEAPGNAIPSHPAMEPALHPLVVLGSSTGGPFALAEIVAKIPASLRTTLVIVQHVDAAFAPGLGQWLGEHARRKVQLITEGLAPAVGKLLLSGTDDHLMLGPDRRLHYSGEPRALNYRPSVDVFFKSVALHWPRPGVAALLTGMGRDGAEGLLELRRAGWKTIAQDESTSVVWGMPRAAAELGGAEYVLPLPRIAETIVQLLPT